MRFLFSTVVWGADYTRDFLDLSLPTQLAEGNLDGFPWISDALYQIFTTERDGEAIRNAPIFRRLSRMMATDFVFIDRIRGTDKYNRTNLCQVEAIRRAGGFDGIFLHYPDTIWSKGCLTRAAARIVEGHDAVVCPAPRVATGGFAGELLKTNKFATETRDGRIISLPARDLVAMSLRHLHSTLDDHFWDAEQFTNYPSYLMWEVAGQGVLFRNYHLHPAVLRVQRDNPDFFLPFKISLDEEYLPRLFKSSDRIYFATDSDELAACSVTLDDLSFQSHRGTLKMSTVLMARWAEEYAALLHREFVKVPFRWHHTEIDEDLWAEVERRSGAIVAEIGEKLRVPDSLLRLENPAAYEARRRRLRRFKHWRRAKFGAPKRPKFSLPSHVPFVPDDVLRDLLIKRLYRAPVLRLYSFIEALPGYGLVRRDLQRFGWWQRLRAKIGSEWGADSYSYLSVWTLCTKLVRHYLGKIAKWIGLNRRGEGGPV